MTTLKPLNGKDPEDYRLIYSISVDDIRFAKQQQWRITYYTLIIMSGIYYIRSHYILSCFWEIFLPICTSVACISAVVILGFIEKDIRRYRSRLLQVRASLTNEFMSIVKLDKKYLTKSYKPGYLLIQRVSILVSAYLFIFMPSNLSN